MSGIQARRGAPTPPIALGRDAAEVTAHLAARRVEVDAVLLERLRGACASVTQDPAALSEASRDWWPLAMIWALDGEVAARAAALAAPTSASEVADVLRVCHEAGIPVTAAGGRSGVCGASIPLAGGVLLDLCGITGIVEVDRDSMILDVRAGTFGDVLEDELRSAHHVTVGHWPQSVDLSTVGGWLACRGAGSTRPGTGRSRTSSSGSTSFSPTAERSRPAVRHVPRSARI